MLEPMKRLMAISIEPMMKRRSTGRISANSTAVAPAVQIASAAGREEAAHVRYSTIRRLASWPPMALKAALSDALSGA